jgi:beta-glucanase (GH16 family)
MNTPYKFILVVLLTTVVLVFFLFSSDYAKEKDEQPMKPLSESNSQGATEIGTTNQDDIDCQDQPLVPEGSSTPSHDGWELVWRDEFDNNCLDQRNWNVEDWAAEKNNELQYYYPKNVVVEDGVLKLISKNEKYRGKDYTSGAIHSKGKFDFLYGKAEMRAKLPAGQGIFPAFWMMTDKENTWLPEIDIMEMLGHQPDEVWMVSHWLGTDGNLKSLSNTFKGPDFSKCFHTFSIEWTPNSLTWLIDGVERFKTDRQIPSEKMYLYLNTAVGGNWPGSPDQSTIFPVTYEIDYVRVFRQK